MTIPVCVLAVLSIVGGFDKAPFARFIATALPSFQEGIGGITETLSSIVAALAFVCGLLGAWFVYQRNPALATAIVENPAGRAVTPLLGSPIGEWTGSTIGSSSDRWFGSRA